MLYPLSYGDICLSCEAFNLNSPVGSWNSTQDAGIFLCQISLSYLRICSLNLSSNYHRPIASRFSRLTGEFRLTQENRIFSIRAGRNFTLLESVFKTHTRSDIPGRAPLIPGNDPPCIYKFLMRVFSSHREQVRLFQRTETP